jgi:hypothetical protein
MNYTKRYNLQIIFWSTTVIRKAIYVFNLIKDYNTNIIQENDGNINNKSIT